MVAQRVNEAVYAASKNGDKFLGAIMSKHIMKRLFKRQNERMSTIALSYLGPITLEPTYGNIRVQSVHGLSPTNRLGPEYAAFGRLFQGQLILDTMYMTADLKGDQAAGIDDEIKQLLTST